MKKLILLFVPFVLFSCDPELKYKDIEVNFAVTELGIEGDENSAVLNIELSRAAKYPLEITVDLESDMIYSADYTSQPAVENGKIKVNIAKGNSTGSITISKAVGKYYEGTEAIKFTVSGLSAEDGFVMGAKTNSILNFAGIVSEGETLTLEGKTGESVYANIVYVDFSTNTQSPVDRTLWNIGFYCGEEFRVILNGSYSTTATASTKSDIAAVTTDDANAALNISASTMVNVDFLSFYAVDEHDGSLSGTVFAGISANDAENKVYFVASEPDKASRNDWYKVKVNRKNEGYAVQYCKVGETAVKSIEIPKNADYNIVGLSLADNSIQMVEPKAKKWDIMWGYNTGYTIDRPYFMQDYAVSNNLGGVKTAEVLTGDVSYENFAFPDIASLTLLNTKNVIAGNWRTTGMGGGGVKTDRFYVVKDAAGNYYKMRFTKFGLGNDGAERGRPVLEYALVKNQ